MPKIAIDTLPRHDGPDAAAPFGGPLGRYEGRAISTSCCIRADG